MISLSFDEYIQKVKGCYLGKAVGGTLGMPFEGNLSSQTLTYYKNIPDTMIPNDDVDLQVVYTETLYRFGLPVNRCQLADAWAHLRFGPDEYGVAKYHLNKGFYPPVSGAFENYFTRGMGAAIRSELWACMAPGDPSLAATLAREDACIDHNGDGIDAAVFLAALQSAAFTESDREKLLSTAFSFIPENGILSTALHDVILWWQQTSELFTVREKILQKYANVNWTDITVNLSFILLGWLAGGKDFGKAICSTVNCGYDADCTGATLGALLGIIAPESIGKEWTDPIGESLVLSSNIVGMHNTDTIDKFTLHLAALSYKALSYYNSNITLEGVPEEIIKTAEGIKVNTKHKELIQLNTTERDSLFSVSPLILNLRYPEAICANAHMPDDYLLSISNPLAFRISGSVSVTSAAGDITLGNNEFTLDEGETTQFSFLFSANSEICGCLDCFDIAITVNGINFNYTVPAVKAIPWRDADTGVLSPVNGFTRKLDSGKHRYTVSFNLPINQSVAVSCICSRDIRLYINGKLIKKGSTSTAVASVHRGAASAIPLKCGKNTVLIEVADGEGGELFFALGDLDSWIWLDGIDWYPTK